MEPKCLWMPLFNTKVPLTLSVRDNYKYLLSFCILLSSSTIKGPKTSQKIHLAFDHPLNFNFSQ